MTKEEIIELLKKERECYIHDRDSYKEMYQESCKYNNIDDANKKYRWYCEAREVIAELTFILNQIEKGDKEDDKDQD